jgi:ssDNA-binding replication factor A large subunit
VYDFDSLVDEVLRNKPELTREEIMGMIEEKRQTVGAGFLTEQGALFLIAGELGIRLNHMVATDLTLKDLYVGANDITVVARVLAIYPISEFKKKDGRAGRYRKLVLFDRSGLCRLTIWEDNPDAIKLTDVAVDTPVRVMNGYVRQGLDGRPNLNLGKRGKIEVLRDEKLVSRLAPLASLSTSLDAIEGVQELVAVEGIVLSGSRTSNFTRQDGSGGSLTQFELGAFSTKGKMRIVVWNAVGLEAKSGQKVVVTNLRLRKSMNGDRELHGDSGSVVKVLA